VVVCLMVSSLVVGQAQADSSRGSSCRRLITLIFVDRVRALAIMVVIRRERPRTRIAGQAVKACRIGAHEDSPLPCAYSPFKRRACSSCPWHVTAAARVCWAHANSSPSGAPLAGGGPVSSHCRRSLGIGRYCTGPGIVTGVGTGTVCVVVQAEMIERPKAKISSRKGSAPSPVRRMSHRWRSSS